MDTSPITPQLDAGGSGIYRLAGPFDLVPVGIDYVTVASTGLSYSGFARGLPVINNLNQVAYWASRTAGGVGVFRSGTSVASSDNGFSELMDSPALHPNTSLVAVRGSKVIVVPFSSPGIWTGTTCSAVTPKSSPAPPGFPAMVRRSKRCLAMSPGSARTAPPACTSPAAA